MSKGKRFEGLVYVYRVEYRGIVGESGGCRTNLTNVVGETQEHESTIYGVYMCTIVPL